MPRDRYPRDTDSTDDDADSDRPRRRTPIEVPIDRAATLAELAGVSDDLRQVERAHLSMEKRVRGMELVHADYFGKDGDDGRFARLERDVTAYRAETSTNNLRLGAIETWKAAVGAQRTIIWAVGSVVGGSIAALVLYLIERLIK